MIFPTPAGHCSRLFTLILQSGGAVQDNGMREMGGNELMTTVDSPLMKKTVETRMSR